MKQSKWTDGEEGRGKCESMEDGCEVVEWTGDRFACALLGGNAFSDML